MSKRALLEVETVDIDEMDKLETEKLASQQRRRWPELRRKLKADEIGDELSLETLEYLQEPVFHNFRGNSAKSTYYSKIIVK